MAKLFKIVLDAGHGGKNLVEGSSPNNAVAPNGLLEKDLNLKIVQLVKEKLPQNQFQAFLTRDKDENLSLKSRAIKSKEIGADAFISIHFNASRKTNFDGTEVFISESSDEKDYLLAEQLLRNVSNAASVGKRGIREVDFTVLKGKYHVAKTAACLIEMAYLTNPNQAKNLSSPEYIDKLASAVTKAIVNYTKQASYAQSLADAKDGEKLVAQFTKEHSDPKNFPIDLPEANNGTDKFSIEIPRGLKLSRWEVEVLEISSGASYKVVKFPPPKSIGNQQIHIEWNHLPYGKINYKLKVYASADGNGTPEKIYFNSSGWMEKAKDQISQGVPIQLAVKGEKAKQIYEALRKKQSENAQQNSYEDYSIAMVDPVITPTVIIVGILAIGAIILAVLGVATFLIFKEIITKAMEKGYDIKDTKFKTSVGGGELKQDNEIVFNLLKPKESKSQSFGLNDDLDSSHFESLESFLLDDNSIFDRT
jgi:N-acetylmuramoyl-L-alanine amidase